jgi:RNA polymerase sigma-70 factor (ECF subfamily)
MAGDQNVDDLFGRFRPELKVQAHIMLRRAGVADGKMDADDVVQNVLIKAHQKQQDCRAANGDASVWSWLMSILRTQVLNVCRDLRRDRRNVDRERSLDAVAAADSGHVRAGLAADHSSPSKRLKVFETLEGLRASIAHLPPELKEVVVPLTQGLPRGELPDRLGLSRGVVATRLAAAFRIMCRFLREGGHDSRHAD